MNVLKGARPSPAMLISMIALVLAFGGTALAAFDPTKKNVKTVAKKQANKAIDAREASLNVNSAKTADSATNATNATNAANADTVGGGNTIKPVNFAVSGVVGDTVVLNNFNGLTITVSCAAGPVLSASATSSANGAQFNTSGMSNNTVVNQNSDDTFDVGDTQNLLLTETDLVNGKSEYLNPNGKHVSVLWAADDHTTGPACEFNGTAIGN